MRVCALALALARVCVRVCVCARAGVGVCARECVCECFENVHPLFELIQQLHNKGGDTPLILKRKTIITSQNIFFRVLKTLCNGHIIIIIFHTAQHFYKLFAYKM